MRSHKEEVVYFIVLELQFKRINGNLILRNYLNKKKYYLSFIQLINILFLTLNVLFESS